MSGTILTLDTKKVSGTIYDAECNKARTAGLVRFSGCDGVSPRRYCYANDNPYRYTDPDGRMADQDQEKSPCTGSLTGNCGGENLKVTIVDDSYRRGADTGAHGRQQTTSRSVLVGQNDLRKGPDNPNSNSDAGGILFARKAEQFGSSSESAGDWVGLFGFGTMGAGGATGDPWFVGAGASGVEIGGAVKGFGITVQGTAAAYISLKEKSWKPFMRFVFSHMAGSIMPPALPGSDPAGKFGDQMTNYVTRPQNQDNDNAQH